LRIEPSIIAEDATSVVCRLIAPPEATLGIYTLRIIGQAQAGDATLSSVARVQPLVDRQLINVDLIKYALREDQRRLPPTLTDRMALQITPPAPFDVELPSPSIVLPRFQQADLAIATTRTAGFESPITFAVAGGQLGDEAEDRHRVFARLPAAMPGQSQVVGTLHSRILSNEAKVRVDLSATAEHQGRMITLVRAFELDLKPAFDVAIEPAQVSLDPGGSIKLKLSASRLPSFAGPIGVNFNPVPGLTLPETVTLAAGGESAEIELAIPLDFAPRKFKLRYQGTGVVNKFEEETRPKDLDIEVKKPEAVKK
jgi:hypothetical protein